MHFRVPARVLRPLIPRSLSVDEKDGTAWVSMTPFTMRRAHLAAPGSLEEFLVERYRLYSRAAGRVLWTAKVEHEPWLLQPAKIGELSETLSAAAGFEAGAPSLAHWTLGVAVDFQPFTLAA